MKKRTVAHSVYILWCADGTLYVGCTNNLEKRLAEHNASKRGARYTKMRRPVTLAYAERLPSLLEGRAREAAIKRMTRAKKMALIARKVDF